MGSEMCIRDRGVTLSKGTIDILLEAGWVKPKGRRKMPGRPVTWGTTEGFLDHFGLDGLDALPGIGELKAAGLLARRQGFGPLAEQLGIGEETSADLSEDVEDVEDVEDEDEVDLNEIDQDLKSPANDSVLG